MSNMSIVSPALEKGYGMLETLERQITPDEVRRLERLGYIENAISPKGATWRLSKKGKRMRECLMQKQTLGSRCSDFFYKHILHYHVNL